MEPKPPGSPAKTPWKGVRLEKLAINLTDAMEDSPIFRDKIKREEEVRIHGCCIDCSATGRINIKIYFALNRDWTI